MSYNTTVTLLGCGHGNHVFVYQQGNASPVNPLCKQDDLVEQNLRFGILFGVRLGEPPLHGSETGPCCCVSDSLPWRARKLTPNQLCKPDHLVEQNLRFSILFGARLRDPFAWSDTWRSLWIPVVSLTLASRLRFGAPSPTLSQ